MTSIDPGLMTLIASCVGALLFFCAGMFWNGRPASVPSQQSPAPDLSLRPAPARMSSSLLAQTAAAGANRAPARPTASRVTPAYLPATEEIHTGASSATTSLRSALEQLTGRLSASSILVLDQDGLLFTEGRDAQGVGARLCTLLAAQAELPADNPRFEGAKAFELGRLRLQRLDDRIGPDAWLATVGAERFAGRHELETIARALAFELGA